MRTAARHEVRPACRPRGFRDRGPSAQKTQLLVYTALETDQLKAYQEGFNKVEPEHRDQVGARFHRRDHRQAAGRKSQPAGRRGDGRGRVEPGAVRQARHARALRADEPRRDHEQYRDKKNPPAWWGMDVWGAVVCFNTVEAQKKNIPKPETWKDLPKPVYKGQVVMPNPASSGTGYFDVVGLAADVGRRQRQGRRLEVHGRAAREHRASTRTRAPSPATWPRPASTWSASRSSTAATANKSKGAPIDLVFPKEGLGWDLEAFAHPQGHQEARGGEEAGRLGVEQGRDDAVRQELRDHRAARRRARWPTCRSRLRVAPDEDGLQLGRRATASASWPNGTSATTARSEKR